MSVPVDFMQIRCGYCADWKTGFRTGTAKKTPPKKVKTMWSFRQKGGEKDSPLGKVGLYLGLWFRRDTECVGRHREGGGLGRTKCESEVGRGRRGQLCEHTRGRHGRF